MGKKEITDMLSSECERLKVGGKRTQTATQEIKRSDHQILLRRRLRREKEEGGGVPCPSGGG